MVGRIDSRHGGLRARFDVLPDAPVTKFTMTLRGGEHGLIVNATDICAYPQVATAKFIGQDNGNIRPPAPLATDDCGRRKRQEGKAMSGAESGGAQLMVPALC